MVDICSCDVHDKEKLALFIHKRKEWERLLMDRSPHSVYNQVTHMVRNDAVFRTFNEARRLTIKRSSPECGLNGPLMRLLDEVFVESQVMAIRRLTDRNFPDPERAVISLIRLIDDIKKHSNLITREIYICWDGRTSYTEPNKTDDTEPLVHWSTRQRNFDKISSIPEDKRDRADRISRSLMERLEQNLRTCDGLRKYANKFIAHASDPQTNIELSEEEKKITLEKLDECYRAIVRTASFLGNILLYGEDLLSGGLPQPLHLTNLDKPMVNTEDMKNLRMFYNMRSQEVSGWEDNLLAKY